jgi:UDP-N-acetylmuramoylalanine--D-glutamate ligase
MFPARRFSGKKVALFGLARSGEACAAALTAGGAAVSAWDDSPAALTKARAAGLPVGDLREADFATFDCLVLSPGVPFTHPEPHWAVKAAHKAGIEIIGDTEVFLREIEGTGSRVVAITGTNGKSTTTALIGHILKAAGIDAHVGGNIGTAVFLLPPPARGRVYVLELSSYQIDLSPGLAPDVGIIMNLTPDHLDRHGTMENYAAVKARMIARQGPEDTAIVFIDDSWCRAIAEGRSSRARLVPMSVERPLEEGVSGVDGILTLRREGKTLARIDMGGARALRGKHNWQNAAAALAATHALGLDPDAIAEGLRSFPGLAHRMEQVGRLGRVVFVNDSKATNADAAARALASFPVIYWIAGGRPKTGGIVDLAPYFPRIRRAYLIGEAAAEFALTLDGQVPHESCGTLDRAVAAAARDAARDEAEEPVVLLSPACASFDQYPNFEVRGEAFCAAVRQIRGIVVSRGEVA